MLLYRTSDLRFFGTTQATESGHEIWNLECQEPLWIRLIEKCSFYLYGCETLSLTLMKEHRLMVPQIEKKVLRRVFGSKNRTEKISSWVIL
jgi:hypothetical protein